MGAPAPLPREEERLKVQRSVVYMAMSEDGPLFQGDDLLVFEDEDDAYHAVVEMGWDASVVEIALSDVVERVRARSGMWRVAFVAGGAGVPTPLSLDDLAALTW